MLSLAFVLAHAVASGGGSGGERRLEAVDAEDGDAGWLAVSNGNAPAGNLVVCNTGPPMRPATEGDPHARGFQWKWGLRKLVKVEARGGG